MRNFYFQPLVARGVTWEPVAAVVLVGLLAWGVYWCVGDYRGGHDHYEQVRVVTHHYEPAWDEVSGHWGGKKNKQWIETSDHHDEVFTLFLDRPSQEELYSYVATSREYYQWGDGSMPYLKIRVGRSGTEYAHTLVSHGKPKKP